MTQETLEEVAFENSIDYKPFEYNLSPQKYFEYGFIKGAKWQAERSYSEEEVQLILSKLLFDIKHKKAENSVKWFEQFKKK